MALNGLFCTDAPLRNYSLTHLHSTNAIIITYGQPTKPREYRSAGTVLVQMLKTT